jgi:hypothetical protein
VLREVLPVLREVLPVLTLLQLPLLLLLPPLRRRRPRQEALVGFGRGGSVVPMECDLK